MPRHMNLAKGVTLLAATMVAANPIAMELYNELLKREPPRALPQNATPNELKWQPSLDFDADGCYNTPAIDANGNVAQGMDNNYTGANSGCRDLVDLDNNNVYVRSRCNNNWCAYVYAYYFEKDVAVQRVKEIGGHRHDWEHIVVFVEGDTSRIVSVSQHSGYDVRDAPAARWDGTHPKVVYHKDGPSTHCFRFADPGDDNIENHKHVWFRGGLINYHFGFPALWIRDKLMGWGFGKATLGIKDSQFQGKIDSARGGRYTGAFNSGFDG